LLERCEIIANPGSGSSAALERARDQPGRIVRQRGMCVRYRPVPGAKCGREPLRCFAAVLRGEWCSDKGAFRRGVTHHTLPPVAAEERGRQVLPACLA